MNTKTKNAALIILLLLAFAAIISVVTPTSTPTPDPTPSPTPAPSPDASVAQVITTDKPHSEIKVTQFSLGQIVYVEYTIQTDKTANIAVFDDEDKLVAGTEHPGVSGTGGFSFRPPRPGTYYVTVNGCKQGAIAVASFFVLPESVFGGVAALGAGIAAFGAIKYKQNLSKGNI